MSTPARASAPPPYLRIKEQLKRDLARGRYPPGARMPSEAEAPGLAAPGSNCSTVRGRRARA